MVQDFLKLGCSFFPLSCPKVSLAANVCRQHSWEETKLIRRCRLQQFNRFARIASVDLDLATNGGYPNTIDECIGRKALAQLICRTSRLAHVARHRLCHPGEDQREPASIHGNCRLRGFTRLTESTEVDEVVALLNDYFAVITEAAYRHDGTIFSMAGDNLLVGFNVPFPQPDAAALAWRAAHEMAASARPVLDRWASRGRPLLITCR